MMQAGYTLRILLEVVLRVWQAEENLNAQQGHALDRLMAVLDRLLHLFCGQEDGSACFVVRNTDTTHSA